MREFLQIMRRALLAEQQIDEAINVPETPYGYWVLPDGSIHPVDYFQHGSAMRALDPDMWTYTDAFNAGWVRVVAEQGELTIETTTGIISPPSLLAIQAMSRLPNLFRFCGEIGEHYKTLDDPKLFMGFVRRAVAEQTGV